MDIGSVVNQSLIGMQKSQTEMTQSAGEIARVSSTREPMDLVEPAVNIQAQQQVFDSSARVMESADEAIGSLLDIKA